jgi:hypothetical protein
MSSHDPERAYVQSVLDRRASQLDKARAAMQADLDRLVESWRSGTEQELEAHEQRMAQLRADQAEWFARFLDGEADEPAPTDVGQGQDGASTGRNAPAPGPGPGQPAYDTERQEAARIKSLSMAAFAAERDQLIRATRPRGMFG